MGVAFAFGVVGILLILFFILLGVAFTGLILLIIGIVTAKIHKKKEIVKKYPKVLIVVGLVLIIVPLILILHFILPSDYRFPDEIYEAQTAQVIEAFQKQDVNSLKETFLTEKQTDALDEKIREAFTYIEGDIVSYDELGRNTFLENDDPVHQKLRYYGGGYHHVITSTGKEYTIYIDSLVFEGDEKHSGIESIVVEETVEGATEEETAEEKEAHSIKIE